MWLYLTPRITFQQEDEDTSGTCDWKYHNLCVWGDTLAHNYSDSRSVLHRLWERMILALWCSQGICDKPLQNHRCANLCSWYHWKSALYDAHTHVREHACLHVDTDTCVCVLLFVCVMNWCTLEKMKYHSYPLSQHEPNDNKHFKRRKCLSLLKCFCSSFTTRCRSNTALFRPYSFSIHYTVLFRSTFCFGIDIIIDVSEQCATGASFYKILAFVSVVYMHYWTKVWNNL